MTVEETALPGVLLVERRVYQDARGHFSELYHERAYRAAGLDAHFVQDNVSASGRGVLRGLHFQHPHGQGKLVSVLAGGVFDVAVDVRRGSPHFGRWVGYDLTAENGRQLWIPPGFAHGFVVVGDGATVLYKCTHFYAPESEQALCWDDPDVGIAWPVGAPVLSPKDAAAPRLRDVPAGRLPPYP